MNTSVPQTSTLAIISLVLGILGWVMLPVVAPIGAIITGHLARAEIKRSQGQISGDGLAVGGLVLGYIQIALLVIGVIMLFLFFGGIAAIAAFSN